MSAGKLSRYTGLVFVLAAFFGGAGASDFGVEHGTGGSSVVTEKASAIAPVIGTTRPQALKALDFEWG